MHILADYAPPRSWDQFEELCADVFQSAWRDPAMVRHGRAGQRQDGVDIVGRNGAMYPVGLQCKRRSTWPVSRLTAKQIDAEVLAATKFRPKLKAFYILTTAPDDKELQTHVRNINAKQTKEGSFEVILLGWGEILRRAIKDAQVADKHFGPNGGAPRSPLLGIWYTKDGRLEKTSSALSLDFRELWEDFQDWPDGHVVVRDRQSDSLIEKIAALGENPKSTTLREQRLELREQLRGVQRREVAAQNGVVRMCTMPELRTYLYQVKQPKLAAECIGAFINEQMAAPGSRNYQSSQFLRMQPPNNKRNERLSASLDKKALTSIEALKAERVKKFGNPLTTSVDELPDDVFAHVAIPRIMRGILEALGDEQRTPIADLIDEGWFSIGRWKIDIA
ncbi:hypothetical protein V5F77_15460 [Xanthobacter sp. DSM 24535]|uniref:hypothetical protein n=1 Tax=Roseixanthobacter psychrophilus TaxID=3119917 RepID=UPI0037276076